jgi:molybdopterin-guanine dinucleotide biosynthesis protein A
MSEPGTPSAPLYGLVLAGGSSRRMQRDKAALDLHGEPQLAWGYALLARHCERVFVSVRADQRTETVRAGFPQIVDTVEGAGPIAGIAAAQAAHPHAAWLVLACDLPFVDDGTLTRLVAARSPGRPVTAYRSTGDGLPEPLCAVYEPESASMVREAVSGGRTTQAHHRERRAAAGAGRPAARQRQHAGGPRGRAPAARDVARMKSIEVHYYAILRDQAGRRMERVETGAATAAELFDELAVRHGLGLTRDAMRVAINDDFGDWQQTLESGDRVVFIPPVAGG